jgi:hypothetical protein
MCEQYAGVIEQLEVLKPGSQEHQRLVQLSQQLGAALEESRHAVDADPSAFPGIEKIPDSALAVARDLLRRSETLSEREQGRLDVLLDAMRGEVLLRGDVVPANPPPVKIPAPASADPPVTVTADTATPEPEPCRYCHQPPARCDEINGRDLDTWRVLHFDHPEEITRRDQARTTEMLESLRRRTRSPFL